MQSLFAYSDYKTFVRDWVAAQPSGGRGAYQKIATKLRMHRTSVSQVFSGEKHLSLEQASELIEFLGIRDADAPYFLALVEHARAGSAHLRERLARMLADLRRRGESEVPSESTREIQTRTQAEFYANWRHAAVSVLGSIPKYRSPDAISDRLRLPKKAVMQSLYFLEEIGLCRVATNGDCTPIAEATYLPPTSALIDSHRTQWRMQAIERFPRLAKDEVAFSAPVSLSKRDFAEFQGEIRTLIERLYARARKTTPELGAIFNVDWMRL